eukprot:TRINITY_DN47855_c0_g1_i1.p1 TRINITY_DN47855_c0_g1~~TRINITY_DN47855_c0_g1_i1.p1  ORF type:complete len:339 (-),score=41.18 TRINITY_DN47855_c0_g1_i1:130-1146(-)
MEEASRRKVLVTGATGYIASELIAQLLDKGYEVTAAARNLEKAACLSQLPCGDDPRRLRVVHLDLIDGPDKFVAAMQGCDAVFHVASPMSGDGEEGIVRPAVAGVQSVLSASAQTPSVKTVVLTSSVAAIEPQPDPPMKSEMMWSDPEEQKERGNFYALSKTLAERAAWDFMDREAPHFRLVTVLPSMVFGPSRLPSKESTGSLGFLRDWFRKGREGCCPYYPEDWPHGHFSMIDVRDLCAQQIACLEQAGATGRYLSLAECDGWTDLDKLMNEVYPSMPLSAPVPEPVASRFGKPIASPMVTRWDLSRMQSLGITTRAVREILQESFEFLRDRGELT